MGLAPRFLAPSLPFCPALCRGVWGSYLRGSRPVSSLPSRSHCAYQETEAQRLTTSSQNISTFWGVHLAQASMCLLHGIDYEISGWHLCRVPAFCGVACPLGGFDQGLLIWAGRVAPP